MIEVKRGNCDGHLVMSPADDAATSSAANSVADTSDEPQASASQLPQPPCENDTDREEDETQDELTSDQLRPLRLELTPESQLDSTDPVYVDLLDCSAPVTHVLKWLTSATWCVCSC